MQKDFHFYLTYALARQLGTSKQVAERIAWANQYTDDLTRARLYEIQTQSAILGNWKDRQIQLTVIIPFHFIPGHDENSPWTVTQNNSRAQTLVKMAGNNHLQFGIAQHALQDTFSHQGFSGWDEPTNGRYLFWYIPNPLPNVGHTDLGPAPDVINYVWTDPKDGRVINNRKRALENARVTNEFLCNLEDLEPEKYWGFVEPTVKQIFSIKSYDRRKEELIRLSGDRVRYKEVRERLEKKYKPEFISAAAVHLSRMMQTISKLKTVSE